MPFRVHEEIAQAETIESAFYTDPAVFERSKAAIFAKSWQFLGSVDDLAKVPGSVYPLTLLEGCLDEPILITRGMDDGLHCMSNVCTHRGMLVAETPGNERFLRCRYHGRRFGLDGRFQSMPEFEGVCGFPTERDSLPAVSMDNFGPFLFASLDPAVTLKEVLAPIHERVGWLPLHEFRFDRARARDYAVKAHWALYVDNYLEGFHIPFIHAALNQAIDYENYTTHLHRWCNLQLAVAKGDEAVFDLPESSPDYGTSVAAYYYWAFPNLMLNFYPWGLSVNVLRPLGHDRTKISFLPYVWKEELRGSGASADLDRVEREDEVVVEAVQRGLRSKFYDRGRYSVAREQCVHQFHLLLAAAL